TIVGYIGLNVIDYLSTRLNLPVSVMNDVNSMALCEANLGAAKDSKLTIALTVGTGIGGAIVLNGHLIEGHGFSAGEFGLMQIESEVYEQIASTAALVRLAKSTLGDQVSNGVDVFRLYDQGNALAIKAVNTFYNNLSIGIANLVCAFNPELVVIGGGITARTSFVDELSLFIYAKLNDHLKKYTQIKAAAYKNDAGMIGAFYHFLTKYPQ
ncbi:MAG: ROK family protein, partial [Tenericutes bacterium HGW-Tenericutes-8]